ncbi:hypothetical protein JN11_01557 [Mucilaginibacter frigoritolerans]|uniref:Uncharacterized protein n=1 Tax=Mucilaginibacter frigoritolerans TaxID=652788 RepID=A0A562U9R9_9SPHI|nr:hypothetical protein JN11_01557 [Mucilaginibacter frigoritolerans]
MGWDMRLCQYRIASQNTMKIVDHLFYKFYLVSTNLGSSGSTSAANAYLNSSIFLSLNLGTTMALVDILAGKPILKHILITRFILFIPLIWMYYSSIYKNKYLKKNKAFENESKLRNNISTAITIIYCLLSLYLFYHFGELERALN